LKIAHISDLHLNTFYRDSNLREIKSLLRYCLEMGVDHLAITGDLTDDASEDDLRILRKTLISFGFDTDEKLSVIVGNHDIYGGVQKAEDIFSFPDRCRKTNYRKKIKSFNSIFNFTFENCVYQGEELQYPYAKLLNDVLLIGMNSNAEYSSISNPFASNGEVSEQQQSELIKILSTYGSEAKHKIILIHHHFNKIKSLNNFSSAGLWQNIEKQTMKLRKKKKLIKIFNELDVNLVLHGHLHETTAYQKSDIDFYNAGGSVKGVNSKKLKFNLINIGDEGINVELLKLPGNYVNEIRKVNSKELEMDAA